MKKWKRPELLVLGIESTNEKGKPNMHYCHKFGVVHATNECKSDHPVSGNCPEKDSHKWNEGKLSNCCCYGLGSLKQS